MGILLPFQLNFPPDTPNFHHRYLETLMKLSARIVIILYIVLMLTPIKLLSQFSLTLVEQKIAVDHPVQHRAVNELKQQLAGGDSLLPLFFDVRESPEYRISHLQDAIRVSPDMKAEAFMKAYGALLAGREAVFYCSVGKRSAIFIERIADAADSSGVIALMNLRGGIFRWYNSGMPVYNDSGLTNDIHPYNKKWGLLVDLRPGAKFPERP